jgi:hypothetical protein
MVAEDQAEPGKRIRGKRPPDGEPVIDRALALLAAFDAGHRRLTLRELSRRSGIPVSSTLRMAGRLLAWGALERDEEGRYAVRSLPSRCRRRCCPCRCTASPTRT